MLTRGFVVILIFALSEAGIMYLQSHPPLHREDITRLHSTPIHARGGELLRELPSAHDTFGQWIPLSEIAPHLITATLHMEDQRFYRHIGVDPVALGHALWMNLRAERVVRGASTIPQQIIRSAHGYPRTFAGKIRTMAEAIWLTIATSKAMQLEYYFNLVSYGGDGIGIAEAARDYFGTTPDRLTLAQGAFLAVIPKSPLQRNPRSNFERARTAQHALLRRMHARGVIATESAHRAATDAVEIQPKRSRPLLAPHFTEHVRRVATDPGHVITTTLDLDLQREAEHLVSHHLARTARFNIRQASVVILDNATRGIRAWVGSADYADAQAEGQVDGVLAYRQPGSALKPFTYALALQDGMTAATILPDIPTTYFLNRRERYIPHNYNHAFHGPVRLRAALAGSLNVPAVHVAKAIGPARIIALLQSLGMPLQEPPWHYGIGVTLGNGEVRLRDLTNAYATLAAGGRWRPVRATPGVDATTRVLPADVTAIITDILSDTLTRDQFFSHNNPFHFPFPVAIKTGTSSNWRDNWSFGYTHDFTVGVWVGNFDGSPMQGTSGATGAGPLLRDVILATSQHYPRRDVLSTSADLQEQTICTLSGLRATDYCPRKRREVFVPQTAPTAPCDYHQITHLDRRNGLLATRDCDRRFVVEQPGVLYPRAYRAWARDTGRGLSGYSPRCPPPRETPSIAITSPRSGARFLLDPARHAQFQSVPLTADSSIPYEPITWEIDGAPLATSFFPHTATRLPLTRGPHTIRAHSAGQASAPVNIEVR
jgi:penicillin-binding protein 1C